MLCCGSSEQDWEAVKVLSSKCPEIIPAFGVHPWYIKARSNEWLKILETLLVGLPIAAVGEIGLDHALDDRNDEDQASVFIGQLKLAQKLGRPVSIHCRRAWADLATILKRYGLPDGGVIHSYSGAPDLVPQFEKTGASISFSGSITYDRNKRGRGSAVVVSEDRLLIETDSPDIAPRGVAEGENEPANVVKVAETLAELRGKTIEEISELTYRNACGIFKYCV
jgi:TatD DNase family protein